MEKLTDVLWEIALLPMQRAQIEKHLLEHNAQFSEVLHRQTQASRELAETLTRNREAARTDEQRTEGRVVPPQVRPNIHD